jgi:predicted TIM-barrel fold metal-dependent hydrolase
VQAYQAHLVSLIFSGVFDRIPDLRFVFEEGGFAWVPALVWRLDRTWRLLSDQVPSLSEPPSEIVRRHFWFTTQPMDEPDDPEDLNRVIRHLALDDRLMYASDYPHWDFDSPSRALPRTIGAELKEKIFSRNAGSLFRFDA